MISIRYTNSDYQSDKDFCKFTSRSIFTLGGKPLFRGVLSNNEAKYVAHEVTKKVIFCKFLTYLEDVLDMDKFLTHDYDNNDIVANSREPSSQKKKSIMYKKFIFSHTTKNV